MITIMKPNASSEAVRKVIDLIESRRLIAHLSEGSQVTIAGVVGDETKLLNINIEISEGIDKVVTVTKSCKLVNKKLHPEDSVTPVGNTRIGPGTMTTMVGPCAIELQDQLMEAVRAVKKVRATFLCGGAYKPRISPYSLQGLEEEGLKYMREAREATGLNAICEITNAYAIESAMGYIDMLQIGARNMQSFELLEETGKSGTPVLSKCRLCATINEWLSAAEHIISEGNPNTILCERDIRTYETPTRNTLDISAVPVIHQKSHPPIIVDPSHVIGVRAYVEPLAEVAIAVGADGPMIEAHPCPVRALPDGPQSLTFDAFERLMKDLAPYAELFGCTFKAQQQNSMALSLQGVLLHMPGIRPLSLRHPSPYI